MIVLKSPRDIAALREAGRVVAAALEAVRAAAAVGVTLLDLDELAADVIAGAGAVSAFRGYHPHFAPSPFPGAICASRNEVVVHGIPDRTPLRDGDLLSVDCGASLGGWVGDAAFSMIVGAQQPDDVTLISHTRNALHAGIAAARPGARLGDIGSAIGTIGRGNGYGIPQGWGGHGVGRAMHEDPSVPNEGRPGRGMKLRAGMVIAIEPLFIAGAQDDYELAEDGWAVVAASGRRAAHEEHTIAITDQGPVILTVP